MKWCLQFLPNKEKEQAKQELKILEEEVREAYDFLRKNRKSFFNNNKKLPIYLILGPSRFGKTTITSQTGLDLIDVHYNPPGDVIPTKYCSLWFSKNALYIDTAGNYTKPDITKPRNDLIWSGFIKLLQKYFGKDSIAGALIILDLPAISEDKTLLKKTLFCIRERIYEIATLTKNVNAHIIFTKCDRILGFTEFFSTLDHEERLQPFGISFANDRKINIVTAFESKFNKLLKNLNNRIASSLEKTPIPRIKPLIRIFPSQMEHLKQTFIDVISKIPNSSQIIFSGIYFTSSIQKGSPINPIKNTLEHIFNLKEKLTYSLEANDNQSYFINEIFKSNIVPTAPKQEKAYFNLPFLQNKLISALALATLIIATTGTIGYKSFYKNMAVINKTKKFLRTKDIYDHNNLYDMMTQIKKIKSPWLLTLGINKITPIYDSLAKAHQVIFVQNLSSQLENYFDTTIDSVEPNNPQNLYQSLQAYLMFSNPDNLDPTYIKAWFSDYWKQSYSKKEIDYLQQQLDATLQRKFTIETNQQSIDIIRDNLRNLPPLQLVYLLIESKYVGQNLRINDQKTISKIYTKEHFYKTYKDSIPSMARNLPKQNWILGNIDLRIKVGEKNVIKKLRELYIEKYIASWKNIINLETKKELEDLTEISKHLDAISSTNSPLLDLLKLIKHNININTPPTMFTKKLETELEGVNNINPIALQKNLDDLSDYIVKINENTNPNKTAFEAVTQYLQGGFEQNPITNLQAFASNQPDWLQNYLESIVTNSWQALLNATYTYINEEWDRIIIPKYKETVLNKYPIFKKSKEDIDLKNFSRFFGPHGTLDNFFKNFIKPLVNTETTSWNWKTINGQKINFSQDFLEVFLRGEMIQKMFFPSKTTRPKLRFNLKPVAMASHTHSFSLNIGGQKISFANDRNKKTNSLVWPGPKPGSVNMRFVNSKGKYFTKSEAGTWAWFRMLDRINVSPSKNTKLFRLTFNLNGNSAKYTLTTSDSVNPFIPDVVSNFRCLEKIN